MTKTIMILAIAAAFVAGSIATGTVAYAGDDDDDDDEGAAGPAGNAEALTDNPEVNAGPDQTLTGITGDPDGVINVECSPIQLTGTINYDGNSIAPLEFQWEYLGSRPHLIQTNPLA